MATHIGMNMPISAPSMNVAALLSTTNASDGVNVGNGAESHKPVVGHTILELQIRALHKAGCTFFIIEVDQVSHALLELVDGFRREGVSIEFARSIKDLQALVEPEMRLYLLAEDHFLSEKFVIELTTSDGAFIATFDSREENAGFERIDLNTRWSGFASIEAKRIFSMSDLPDDWSIISSLLRHAIQEKVPFLPLQQIVVQKMDIVHVSNSVIADALNIQILRNRADSILGWTERLIYAPIARWLAPHIWKSDGYRVGSKFSGISFAIICFTMVMLDWQDLALWTALLAVFCNHLNIIAMGEDRNRNASSALVVFFWLFLCAAGLAMAYSASDYRSDLVLFMAISIGLALLARKLELPAWTKSVTHSPSLFVFGLIMAQTLSAFSIGLRVLAISQLLLLIAGRYIFESKVVKLNHA